MTHRSRATRWMLGVVGVVIAAVVGLTYRRLEDRNSDLREQLQAKPANVSLINREAAGSIDQAAWTLVFRALLNAPMREGQEGRVEIADMKAPVFRVLLHFVYTDVLPEEHDGSNMDVAMAPQLMVEADRYELIRLRR